MSRRAERIARELDSRREQFMSFLVARVGSAAEAEDLLQQGLLKALRGADRLADDEKAVAWFYRLLRNAVIDHYRARAAVRRRDESVTALVQALGADLASAPPEWEAQLCGCLGGVIGSMRPRQAGLLRRVELAGMPVKEAARELGMTPGNASITLHRARTELRRRLAAFCGACADGACLDCDCAPVKGKRSGV